MSCNKSIENENGIITFYVRGGWGWDRINDPNELASVMSTGEFLDIFTACEGDFLRLEQNTRKAMAIKGQDLNDNYKKRASHQALYRQERAERRHREIIAEIRELMEGKEKFTCLDVQLAAVNRGNGFPVRTRQMYASHLRKAASDNVMTIDISGSCSYINVILSNGRRSSQRIPGNNRQAYSFVK